MSIEDGVVPGGTAAEENGEPEPAKVATTGVIVPNKWELFLVTWPKCACCTFFWLSMVLTMITIMMMRGGDDSKLKLEVNGVWDVRTNDIVEQRDAFMQALQDSGQKLMCEDGGGPQKPCEIETKVREYMERTQVMDMLQIIYEVKGGDKNLLSSKNIALAREFEEKLAALAMYKDNCMLAGHKLVRMVNGSWMSGFDSKLDKTQCVPSQSIINDIFVDNTVHESLMTSKCYTSQPICKAGNAVPPFCAEPNPNNAKDAPKCLKCGAGGTPYGTPPCRSSAAAKWSSEAASLSFLCDPANVQNAAKISKDPVKTAAYFEGQRSKLLPTKFQCDGMTAGKSQLGRSYLSFGAPLDGYKTFVGDDKKKQQDKFIDWFTKDMWPEVQKLRNEIQDKSDGELKIYAMAPLALTRLFNMIFMSDGLLALGSLLFVLFWIWTATGSFFLALCGIYECFISLFLAMLTFSAISRYIGFLCVMMIFVIIGIGADDIFVFLDAFKQSAYEESLQGDIKLRFAWAYRRSVSAMFVTTSTTCVSFLAAGFSEIPTVSAFGFFAAFTVAWDYLMVITFFASATVLYHQWFEGKKGGHMCMDFKCCCCRLLTPPVERRGEGWRAYKPLIITVSILSFLGIVVCAIGSANKMPFVPMLGTILLCIAAICIQAVLNMPTDTKEMRTLESFFHNRFYGFLDRHKKKLVIGWAVVIVACAIAVGAVLRPAEEAPKFLSEDNDIMKFIDLSSEFEGANRQQVLHTVFGIDKKKAFDRSGVDFQEPRGAEKLGVVTYSKSEAERAGSPDGQTAILNYCNKLAGSDLVVKDFNCKTAYHAGTNPTFRLPTLGTEVGHCRTGVYCFMDNVKDFLEAHCRACPAGTTKGCNPAASFKSCKDVDGNVLAATFPAPDLHKVLRSVDFTNYMKSLPELRYKAGHGHENKRYISMTGFRHNVGGFVAFVGGNYSMPSRVNFKTRKSWYDKTKAFVEDNSGFSQAFATTQRFNWMVTEAALVSNTIQAVIIAVVFAWVMLVVTGWNWKIGTLGFMSVVCVCIVSLTIMICMGWELGIIESIAIITVVGVSVDYSVHLIHAFNSSEAETPSDRVRSALSTMGISLIGGVATTTGAALFLWFSEIQFFSKFGQFLAITVIVSMIVAFSFLMPVSILIGPAGNSGKLCTVSCMQPPAAKSKDTE